MENGRTVVSIGTGRVDVIRSVLAEELTKLQTPRVEETPYAFGSRKRDFGDAALAESICSHKVIHAARRSEKIKKITDALRRLQAGWEGTCEDCEDDIPLERIVSVPGVTRCISCQEAYEKTRRRK